MLQYSGLVRTHKIYFHGPYYSLWFYGIFMVHLLFPGFKGPLSKVQIRNYQDDQLPGSNWGSDGKFSIISDEFFALKN